MCPDDGLNSESTRHLAAIDFLNTLKLEQYASLSCYLLRQITIETGDNGLNSAWIQNIKHLINFRGGSFN